MHNQAESLWMLYDLGEWDRLLNDGQRIMLYSEKREGTHVEIAALPYMAQVLARRQQWEEAFALCERLLPRAREAADLQTLVPTLAASADVAQMRGQPEVAVGLIEELSQVTQPSGPWRSRQLPTALRVLISAGELEKAETFVGAIEVTATRDCNCVLTARAILAEAKGDTDEARDLYHQVAQRWTDYGYVLEEGQAHLGLARCLIAVGDRQAATEPLQKARAIFSRLGAAPLLNETDTYLQQREAAS